VIKKVVEINPALSIRDVAALIRQATSLRPGASIEYADVELIDEELALDLARKSLQS
jgi:hypothetical protein